MLQFKAAGGVADTNQQRLVIVGGPLAPAPLQKHNLSVITLLGTVSVRAASDRSWKHSSAGVHTLLSLLLGKEYLIIFAPFLPQRL